MFPLCSRRASIIRFQTMNFSNPFALPVLAALLVPMNLNAQTTNSPLTEGRVTWKVNRQGEMRYLLYLPKDYGAKSDQRWPLMLFLHGAGERGTNLQVV